MKKRVFVILEIIMPLIFFFSWMLWNIVIKKYAFGEAFMISTGITFMIVITTNVLVALNYKKLLDDY